jgi:hypothetical protein
LPIASHTLPDDPEALKRNIAEMAQDADAQTEIARLKFQLARERRVEFGRSLEKLGREEEHPEPAIETLEIEQAELLATASAPVAAAVEITTERISRRGAGCRSAETASRGFAVLRSAIPAIPRRAGQPATASDPPGAAADTMTQTERCERTDRRQATPAQSV